VIEGGGGGGELGVAVEDEEPEAAEVDGALAWTGLVCVARLHIRAHLAPHVALPLTPLRPLDDVVPLAGA
jgi:hypothetical protein